MHFSLITQTKYNKQMALKNDLGELFLSATLMQTDFISQYLLPIKRIIIDLCERGSLLDMSHYMSSVIHFWAIISLLLQQYHVRNTT